MKIKRGAFRVWDNKETQYTSHTGYSPFLLSQEGGLKLDHGEYGVMTEPYGRYTVEHFTGFYDADENPIFEGDILFNSDNGQQVVLWDDRYGWCINKKSTSLIFEFFKDFAENSKIVGTIHDEN